jgi:rare lipoprotein A
MNTSTSRRHGRILFARVDAFAVASFAFLNSGNVTSRAESELDVTSNVRGAGFPAPKRGGTYRVGEPYVIAGRTYTPREEPDYRAEGVASWYGDKFHGRLTANGEVYDMFALSAAHPTLPLPSYARVTNLENGKSLIVRLNDRGPFHDSRLIDVSVRTAKLLGFYEQGITKVKVDYIGPAELAGSDDEKLAETLIDNNAPAVDVSVDSKVSEPTGYMYSKLIFD